MNVLVTAGRTRVAYTICKSLAKHGFRVFTADSLRPAMSAFSRHSSGSFVYASPFAQEERFFADLEEFIRKKSIDILIPVMEETYCLARSRDRLDGLARMLLPEYGHILRVHDKGALVESAHAAGVAVPGTINASELLAMDAPERILGRYPVILKPRQGGGGWAMSRFDNLESLLAAVGRLPAPELYVAQEMITGAHVCACAIYQNGVFISGDAYEMLTVYPKPFGQATTRRSVPGGEPLAALRRLLDHFRWNGVCEADFIIDERDNTCFLLDVNPRFWGGLIQNIAAGADYPYYYCQLAQGNPVDARPETADPVYTRWVGGEYMRIATEFFASPDKALFYKETRSKKISCAAYDDFDLADPLPFFVWAGDVLFRKLFKRKADTLSGIWR